MAHVPAFAKEHNIPSGNFDLQALFDKLNEGLKQKFKKDNLVVDIENLQVSLNLPLIQSSSLKLNEIKSWVIDFISTQQGIARVVDIENIATTTLNAKQKEMLVNGYYPARCGQIQLILQPQWIEDYTAGGTTHGVWNPYDAHIPLIWYGWGIKPGKSNREIYMADIAPTIAALLHIQQPSGSIGNVIQEIMK